MVTRNGAPVAELRPLPRSSASPTELIRRRRKITRVNPDTLRRDIDKLINPSVILLGEMSDPTELPDESAIAQ